MSTKSKGIITRITGPVVDIRFGGLELPDIFHAVEIINGDNVYTTEVLQHLGNGEVRCISMVPTDGMSRGMTAIDTDLAERIKAYAAHAENGAEI